MPVYRDDAVVNTNLLIKVKTGTAFVDKYENERKIWSFWSNETKHYTHDIYNISPTKLGWGDFT